MPLLRSQHRVFVGRNEITDNSCTLCESRNNLGSQLLPSKCQLSTIISERSKSIPQQIISNVCFFVNGTLLGWHMARILRMTHCAWAGHATAGALSRNMTTSTDGALPWRGNLWRKVFKEARTFRRQRPLLARRTSVLSWLLPRETGAFVSVAPVSIQRLFAAYSAAFRRLAVPNCCRSRRHLMAC